MKKKQLAVFLAIVLIGAIGFSFVPVSNVSVAINPSGSYLSISTDVVLAVSTTDEPVSNPVGNPPMAGWWNTSYDQRVNFTIDAGDVDSNLTNFPVMLYLSNSSGIGSTDVSCVFDELNSDANRTKIAVVQDNTTECYVEIENWDDANETAWLHTNITSIDNTTNTTLSLYYDKDADNNTAYVGDTNSTPAENVWDGNFKAVYHMADGASNATVYDSTNNNNDGTKASAANPAEVDGKVGKAQDFSSDNILLGNLFGSLPNITIEAWLKLDVLGSYRTILAKSGAEKSFFVAVSNANNLSTIRGDGGSDWSGCDLWYYGDTALTTTWYHTVWQLEGTTHRFFLNGGDDGSGVGSCSGTGSGAANTYIGSEWSGSAFANQFDGIIDELRISDIARSAAWIKASYESERDHLITWGSEEEAPTEVAITNIPDSHNFGTVLANTTNETGLTAFNVTNTGDVAVNISIKGTNMTGSVADEQVVQPDSNDGFWRSDYWFNELHDVDFGAAYSTILETQYYYNAWFRFTSVDIPKDANITTAYLEGCASADYLGDTVNVTIYGADEDNSTILADSTDYTNRPKTSGIDWDAVPHWTNNTWYQSPSLTSVVQTIVNRTNWTSGNAMQFFVMDNGSTLGITAVRCYWACDDYPTKATKLHVEYVYESECWVLNNTATPGADIYGLVAGINGTGSSDTIDVQVNASTDDCYRELSPPGNFQLAIQYNLCGDYDATGYDYSSGMRFATVTVPQGATITAAYISLKAYSYIGQLVDSIIKGEATDNATTFSTKENYDARVRTTASVNWTPAAWVQDTWYNSADTSTIIQEIVNREGWASNNTLVIFWGDAAGWDVQDRTNAYSYDNATADAPKLHIEYTVANGGVYNITVKEASPYNNLVTNLSVNATQEWGLKLYTPTSFSDYNEKTGTVTLTATEA